MSRFKYLLLGFLFLPAITLAAPTTNYFLNIAPTITDTYTNGTASLEWLNGYFKYASTTVTSATTLCLSTDCRSVWSTGSTFGTTSISATAPLNWNTTTAVLSITQSGISTNGYLSSTDFNTFNNKQNAITLGAGTVNSSASNVLYVTATSTVSVGTGISYSGTMGSEIGGIAGTLTNTGVITNSCPGGFLTCSGTNPSTFTLGTLGVANGGTGATTFGQGWLFSVGGTGALAASTSPTVNYITATSTTATSTFAFSINVNSGAVATNNKYLARPAFIYSTTTPGSNDSIVFTGARDSAPSFSGTTLTLPSNIYAIQVEIWGGGAGGASGSVGNSPTNPDPNAGTNGSQTCFSTSSSACSTIASTNIGAMGGSAGAVLGVGDFGSPGGGGGIGSSTADIFLQANPSLNGVSANTGISANGKGGIGGSAPLGGGGGVGVGTRPITAASNGGSPGGGGGGGFGVPDGSTPAVIGGGGGGGGGGGYAEKLYTSIIPYFYTIGIGGIGGAGYSNGGPFTSEPGGIGAAGGIKITGYTY